MATVTLTTDLVTVALAEATDTGVWAGGKESAYWTSAQIEGSGCRAYIGNSVLTYLLSYTPASALNIGTSSVFRIWMNHNDPFNCDTKANGGIAVSISDGTNTGIWNMEGSDTYYGGYKQFIIDTATAPSTGTAPNFSAVTIVGISTVKTLAGKNTETMFVDAIRYGNEIRASGGTSGDEINITLIEAQDASFMYGILMQDSATESFLIRGIIQIGDNVGTADTYFAESGKVLQGGKFDFGATDILGIKFVGNATGTTDISLRGCFVASPDDPLNISCSDTNITALEFVGNTFGNLAVITFQSGQNINNNVFDGCNAINPTGCNFDSNSIANTLAPTTTGSVHIDSATTVTNMSNINFLGYSVNSRYAVYVDASVTAITLNNWQFDDPDNTTGFALYWAGTSGTLTINVSNGTNLVTGGCTAATGGTVTVVSGADFTLTNLVDNTEVRIYTSDLSAELFGVENSSGGSVTYTYSTNVTGAIVQVYNVEYVPIRFSIDLLGTNTSIPIGQVKDRWYSNPT